MLSHIQVWINLVDSIFNAVSFHHHGKINTTWIELEKTSEEKKSKTIHIFKKRRRRIWTSIIPLDGKVDHFLSCNKNICSLERPFICLDY